jgi:hypothetical protein
MCSLSPESVESASMNIAGKQELDRKLSVAPMMDGGYLVCITKSRLIFLINENNDWTPMSLIAK